MLPIKETMEETIPENSENVLVRDLPAGKSDDQELMRGDQVPEAEPVEAGAVLQATETPKRGRGRPAGAKDKAPRAKKARIVEEPLEPPEPAAIAAIAVPEPAPVPAPAPPRASKRQVLQAPTPLRTSAAIAAIAEPPSPRTQQREAAMLLYQLQHQKHEGRRAVLREMYTKDLLSY